MLRILGAFAVLWLILAIFQIADRDTLYVYSVYIKTEKDEGPDRIPINISLYRINGQIVSSKVGQHIQAFDNCIVFDLRNWKCEYPDGSGRFGVNDGEFWLQPEWKHAEYVSRFDYILTLCRSGLADGIIQAFFNCGFSPFII